MFITFDYSCSPCKKWLVNEFVLRTEKDGVTCPSCGKLMTRLPAGTRTTFKFADQKLKS